MAEDAVDNGAVKIDRILSRAAGTIRNNPLIVLGLGLVLGGIPAALFQTVTATRDTQGDAVQLVVLLQVAGAAGLGMLLCYALLQAALVPATLAEEEGGKASLGECASGALRSLLPLVGLNILLWVAIGFGTMLLVVPGIILAVIWAVASPALVAERTGLFGAFSRSKMLTRGARWKVFGVELVGLIFIWLASAALNLVLVASVGSRAFLASGTGVPIWYALLTALVQAVIITFWSTLQASLYVELRNWTDGPQGAALAKVFA